MLLLFFQSHVLFLQAPLLLCENGALFLMAFFQQRQQLACL
jgi:hypothetical protein